ncbi:MAG: arginine--tRNA ligase [Planctomycetes bacterium]|nr:arginine--tRNA ligase [Planctomycetota bacterium]
MSAKESVAKIIASCLQDFEGEMPSVDEILMKLEAPKSVDHGDVAFPCFVLSKVMKMAPPKIAALLLPNIEKSISTSEVVQKVVQVGPYLNFFVESAFLANIIPHILAGEGVKPRASKGEKVMIEYSQPNTHKAFHVGHMRNVSLGDSLVRLYEFGGYEVTAANYIGDEGTHIAKCLWVYGMEPDREIPTTNKGEFLGDLYRQADILLDFKNLTQYPNPGMLTAEVKTITQHPSHDKWKVVQLLVGKEERQVICGGKGYKVGDIVAYVPPLVKLAGRLVEEKDMKGVTSYGVICSIKELNQGKDGENIYLFPEGTSHGLELTEVGRKENALAAEKQVAAEMVKRTTEVSEVLKTLEDKNSSMQELWQETREWSLNDFKEIYSWIDCRFDHYFYESEVGDEGKQIVLDAYEKGLLVKSEGTIGADFQKDKLGFFMLLKSDGTGLYSTKDLALAKKKFENFKIDRSVYVVDYSQSLHFQQVFKTLELLGYEQSKKCYHLAYGLVTLPEGKMSSRKGTVISFSELRKQLSDYVNREFMQKHKGDWSDEEIEQATRAIAIATIKYGMLNQDNLKNIVFDMKEWTSLSGNTGPYLMYAYARTQSIKRKVGKYELNDCDWSLLSSDAEKVLLGELNQFDALVERSIEQNKPQNLCIYLYQLSKSFSRMFEFCPVAKAETESLKITRLALVDATGKVLKTGLSLLGIHTIDRM